ncbi:MAG: hypothetical protein V4773_04040 [Verrucomicrobiota bacterium]
MTLNLDKEETSKREVLYGELSDEGWKKVDRVKVDTAFIRDGMDVEAAVESIARATANADVSLLHLHYVMLAGRVASYKEF